MKYDDFDKLTDVFRKEKVHHLLLARIGEGVSISTMANGDDIFEFFHCLLDTNPEILDIIKDVITIREMEEDDDFDELAN